MKIISADAAAHARDFDACDGAMSAITRAGNGFDARPVDASRSAQKEHALSIMSTAATLIVADDHPLFRAALREAVTRLLPQARIIEAGSLKMLEEAVQANLSADLILLDRSLQQYGADAAPLRQTLKRTTTLLLHHRWPRDGSQPIGLSSREVTTSAEALYAGIGFEARATQVNYSKQFE